ncbi:MAG: ribonuclease HI [Flavobacteriales bacterium]|nr:ribonuclease HI [Flavobacteriales bacterium]
MNPTPNTSAIIIYTDGSALGNPGPGGFGIVLQYGKQYKEVAQGYRLTTNNRMELLAVIVSLEMLKVADRDVIIYSDSKYVIDSVVKGWVFGWVKKGFKGKKNADLWMRFLKIYPKNKVKFQWVKGHNNNPGNERCDLLAVGAANFKQKHLVDEGYEASKAV